MGTDKLYWRDPFATEFMARPVRAAQWNGAPSLVLAETVFYPEGGGQLGDQGVLIGVREQRVVDVQIDDAGDIHHVLERPWDGPLDGQIRGVIDRVRRRDFMSQHTGQHMLSAALAMVARAETVSSRLGAETSTIDVDRAALADDVLAEAAALVNAAVLEDRDVTVSMPTPAELAGLPLRRAPKVKEGIRVVEVPGLDCSPCGGTHCTRTGQVGWVKIVGTERYKGGTRVTFLAGARAIADAGRKEAVLAELSRTFTCGLLDVPAAVAKLRADLRRKQDESAGSRGELLRLSVERLHASHPVGEGTTRILLAREHEDLQGLRGWAAALAARPDVVAFATSRAENGDALLVIERGKHVADLDCDKWFAERRARGARGGGRPDRAEGTLPAAFSVEDEVTR